MSKLNNVSIVPVPESTPRFSGRPRVSGKFITIDSEKFYVKGVTYGTFEPDEAGSQFPSQDTVDEDCARMAASGINTVRTYTAPPGYLLDCAYKHGLKVMVGLPWEQHITFLDSPRRVRDIIDNLKASVAACSYHPAILCYTIGNEIPARMVRWYGRKRIEGFLFRLYKAVKSVDPDGLVTYVKLSHYRVP